jgi:hypothetical protein
MVIPAHRVMQVCQVRMVPPLAVQAFSLQGNFSFDEFNCTY